MISLSWDVEKYQQTIYGLTQEGYDFIHQALDTHFDALLEDNMSDLYVAVWGQIIHIWRLEKEIQLPEHKRLLREHLEYVYNSLDTLQNDEDEYGHRLHGGDYEFLLEELEKVMDQL